MAATELVLLKLTSGQTAEAVAQAKALTPLALQIDNEIVDAAVANLIMAARQGSLTISLTERLVNEMGKCGVGADIPRPRLQKKH